MISAAVLGQAWDAGIGHVDRLLADDVQFIWWSGGEQPCHGRAEVMALIHLLARTSGGALPTFVFEDLANDLVLACDERGVEQPDAPCAAIALHLRNDTVVLMVDYGSRAHALLHASELDAEAALTAATERPFAK